DQDHQSAKQIGKLDLARHPPQLGLDKLVVLAVRTNRCRVSGDVAGHQWILVRDESTPASGIRTIISWPGPAGGDLVRTPRRLGRNPITNDSDNRAPRRRDQ